MKKFKSKTKGKEKEEKKDTQVAQTEMTQLYLKEKIKTPLESVNWFLGGGVPFQTIIEVWGKPKCFHPETLVLMADGSTKMVCDIKVNDYVMGRSSIPRRVKSIHVGKDDMYKIFQSRGSSYIVNSNHDLVLSVLTPKKKKGLISYFWEEKLLTARDFFTLKNELSDSWMRRKRGVREGWDIPNPIYSSYVDFKGIHPYILGLWIGDGNSDSARITCNKVDFNEIFNKVEKINQYTFKCKEYRKGLLTVQIYGLWDDLKRLGLTRGKDCMFENSFLSYYLLLPRKERMELLAGLIDTDGYYNKKNTSNNYEILTKYEKLSKFVKKLINSLGMYASVSKCKKSCYVKGKKFIGFYYRISFSGNQLLEVPVSLSRKKFKIKADMFEKKQNTSTLDINYCGKGSFYGFELEEDPYFLLEDGTVVHNSGKTTFVYGTAGLFLEEYKENALLIVIDSEFSAEETRLKLMGVDKDRIITIPAKTLESGFMSMDKVIRTQLSKSSTMKLMLIWDSIAMAPTEKQMENPGVLNPGGMNERQRIIKTGLSSISPLLNSNISIWILNQVYYNTSMGFTQILSGGGMGLKHGQHFSFGIETGPKEFEGKILKWQKSNMNIEKTKFTPEAVDFPLCINSLEGGIIDKDLSVLEFMVEWKILEEVLRTDGARTGSLTIPGIKRSFKKKTLYSILNKKDAGSVCLLELFKFLFLQYLCGLSPYLRLINSQIYDKPEIMSFLNESVIKYTEEFSDFIKNEKED